ncbi:hypothetical protein LK994_11690 [Ferruginibacter lapsinanis]|uniref:hypothetical protein n=1 Tax=Ferruginibacter lapsinanis TaxID=563172 RepID=UPI001E2D8FDD|nr:hypothetical protein [Ferruginibacter lapsinanis]UEG49294.1 hypothetical protein LK994_11690 [Ferruginibacter lapsinanis]
MIKAFKKISFEHLVTPLIILVGILLFATGSKKNNNIPSANYKQVDSMTDTAMSLKYHPFPF